MIYLLKTHDPYNYNVLNFLTSKQYLMGSLKNKYKFEICSYQYNILFDRPDQTKCVRYAFDTKTQCFVLGAALIRFLNSFYRYYLCL